MAKNAPTPRSAASLAVLLLTASASQAFPPQNDNFNSKIRVHGTQVFRNGTNVDATTEPGEPGHENFGSPVASVWYEWSPLTSGEASVRVNSSGFGGHVFAVYTGFGLFSLSKVASGSGFGSANFTASSFETYLIAVDSKEPFFGQQPSTGTFSLNITLTTAPENDDFSDAEFITANYPQVDQGNTRGAGREPGEPFHASNPGGASAWYATGSGTARRLRLELSTNTFDPLLAVYTGSNVVSLQPVASVQGAGRYAELEFEASAATIYRIAIDGFGGGGGTYSLTTSEVLPPTIYEVWLSGFPDIPPDEAEPGDDPDGDQLPNLIEMFLGTNPTELTVEGEVPSASNRPGIVAEQPLTLEFGLVELPDGEGPPPVLIGQHSTDLITWQEVPIEPAPGGRSSIRFPDGSTSGYLRLQATP